MILAQSKVLFNQEEHSYLLNGNLLSGVTSLLNRQLFPKKYDTIDETVLRKAAERGSLIHETIELVDGLGVTSEMEEVNAYLEIKQENNLTTNCKEYLNSLFSYASNYGSKSLY